MFGSVDVLVGLLFCERVLSKKAKKRVADSSWRRKRSDKKKKKRRDKVKRPEGVEI